MGVYMSAAEINKFRVSLGLKPIVRGKIKCLHCRRDFTSCDVQRRRLCNNCHQSDRELGYHDSTFGSGGLKNSTHYSMDTPTAP